MKSKKTQLVLLVSLGFIGGMLSPAGADQWDQRTTIKFSEPVEIPGQVLPAGTYVFKLADSQSDRNIVQVFSKNQKHLYGTFLTIPDQRLHPAGKTIIRFDERAAGSPEAVRSWFYPGENFGHDFVYPKPKAVALAKANNTPVPSMPAEMAENTTKASTTLTEAPVVALRQAPLKAQKPTEEEVEIAEVFVAQDAAPPTLPATLPATASFMPLIGLIGALSLGLFGAVKFTSKVMGHSQQLCLLQCMFRRLVSTRTSSPAGANGRFQALRFPILTVRAIYGREGGLVICP
jgi:hypothetical protein